MARDALRLGLQSPPRRATNLVKVLYGRRAAADFVDLVRFALEPPRPRWLERTHIADLLAHLTPRSKTVVRLRLMHWTGMRPSQMARLQPEDFRLGEPTPFVVVPRGKGGRLVAIPLVGEGLATAREFMATWAYGRWSCPSANKALERAARRPDARRSPCIRSAMPSRRAFGDRIGRGGHSGSVRSYRPGDDDDLRPAAVAKARGSDRAWSVRAER